MKYCSHCGKEIMDEAVICVNCGCSVNSQTSGQNISNPDDAPNTGFAILGFFIPLAGLILYLLNKDKFPLKAKSAGKGALIGFITGIVFTMLYAIVLGSILS